MMFTVSTSINSVLERFMKNCVRIALGSVLINGLTSVQSKLDNNIIIYHLVILKVLLPHYWISKQYIN